MPQAVLVLDCITVLYGETLAVDGVSLRVHRGEMVALLGPNGSGKSTALAAAAGFIATRTGAVSVAGVNASEQPARYAAQIGFVPQDAALYDELTVLQNLNFFGQLQGLRGQHLNQRVDAALVHARLMEHRGARVHRFSGGMKQRLNIACALLHEPALLLLDEPTANLDAASRAVLHVELLRLRDCGHAILLTTHLEDDAAICDRAVRMQSGRVVPAAVEWSRRSANGRRFASGATVDALLTPRVPVAV